jgi:hypothetical protein
MGGQLKEIVAKLLVSLALNLDMGVPRIRRAESLNGKACEQPNGLFFGLVVSPQPQHFKPYISPDFVRHWLLNLAAPYCITDHQFPKPFFDISIHPTSRVSFPKKTIRPAPRARKPLRLAATREGSAPARTPNPKPFLAILDFWTFFRKAKTPRSLMLTEPAEPRFSRRTRAPGPPGR